MNRYHAMVLVWAWDSEEQETYRMKYVRTAVTAPDPLTAHRMMLERAWEHGWNVWRIVAFKSRPLFQEDQ
jgi:hypothetical protein